MLFARQNRSDSGLQARIQPIQHFPGINMSHYIPLLASLRGYRCCSQFHQQRCTVEWSCEV